MKRLVFLALLVSTGCISYCRFEPVLGKTARGNRSAIQETGELGRPRVPSTAERLPSVLEGFNALAPNLSSTNAETRLAATEALRTLTERAPDVYRNQFPGLFEPLLRDSSPEIRWRAAWLLGRLQESSEGLRAAALDPAEIVAEAACEALGSAHDAQGVPALLKAAERPGPVGRAALAALARLEGTELPDARAWRSYIEAREARRSGTAPVGS